MVSVIPAATHFAWSARHYRGVVFRIRLATAADADAIGEVTREVYTSGGYADPVTSPRYVAELSDGRRRVSEATVFVAEVSGRVVGSVTTTRHGSSLSNLAQPGELEVRMLGVRDAARGQGIGTALMAACHREAGEAGLTALVLCTDPAMAAARRLYEGLGYKRAASCDWQRDGAHLLAYRYDLVSSVRSVDVTTL